MPSAALIQLIPMQELSAGQVGAIRNQVISQVVATASKELHMAEEKLVVRDIRPVADLQIYYSGTTDATSESWAYNSTATTNGYVSITGDKTMGDQRWVAIYGVRDMRLALGGIYTATNVATSGMCQDISRVSLIKISVGGGDKVIWDTRSMGGYTEAQVAFSPSAIIIPQNTTFNIRYYKNMYTVSDCGMFSLQLIGVCVEPRGKVVSP